MFYYGYNKMFKLFDVNYFVILSNRCYLSVLQRDNIHERYSF